MRHNMSGWRSPLLYLGILVIVVATAALVVPPFVDWTRFRADIESYGRRFTGRDVRVDGIIDVRLFPWPVVIMKDIHIANPPGAQTGDLMLAGRIEARLALAPLLSGRMEVEQISIENPVFGLERLAAGGATWQLAPKLELTDYVSAENIAVAGITISRATVFVGDGRRGGLAQLDDVNAELSAPSLDGPWRLNGVASYHGQPIGVSVSTGKYRAGEPLKVGLRVSPVEQSGVVYSFDGEVGGDRADAISGTLKLTPAQTSSGKADAEIDLKPLVFSSAVKVHDDTVEFDKIEVFPARVLDAANLLTGKAVVRLGSAIVIDADLAAAKLDVDAVTGARGRALLYSPSSLEVVAAAQNLLPGNLVGNVKLEIKTLVIAGATLDGARLDATISRQQLTIKRLETLLPGQTKFGFSGSFVSGETGPQLIGDIDLDSLAIRDLATWAVPARARDIAAVWSGARGRLALRAKADLSALAIRLTDIAGELDGAHLGGSLRLAGGAIPSAAIRLDAERLDIDRYAPDGLTLASEETDPFLASVDLIAHSMGFGDFRLSANVARLRLNGVDAEDIAIDMGANEDGIEFRTVDVGNVAGARLDMTGLLHFPDEAVAGSINAKITASDPAGLFRLLGLAGRGDAATIYDRLAALSPLNIEVVGEATADGDLTTSNLKVNGVFGNTALAFNGRFEGNAARWQDGDVHVSAEADDPSSAAVLGLLGFESRASEDAAARLTLSSTGTYGRGLATTLEASAYGARAQFVGALAQGARGPRLSGRLAVLAERAALLYQALGVPAGELSPMAQVLSGEGGFAAEGGRLALEDLKGTMAGISYSGQATADLSGEAPQVGLRLDLGRLSAPWLLDALILPHDSKPHDITTRFPDQFSLPAAIDARLRIDTLDLMPGLALSPASLDLAASDARVDIKARGRSNGEGELALELSAVPGEAGARIAGGIAGQVPLGPVFQESDGTRVITGTSDISLSFAGEGRSPQGLATAATASGSYKLAAGVLGKISPVAFARDLEAASKPEDVDRLIRDSLSSGDMAFSGGEGTLTLDKGVLLASPLAIVAEAAKGELQILFEPAEGKVDIAVTLFLERPAGVPAFEIAYAGHPFALERSSDTQALKSDLVVKVLNESIRQLEELQRREREMREEEEQFKRQQEAKEQTRKEVNRKTDQIKAWQRLRLNREGADLLPAKDNAQTVIEAVGVPVPKTKPPVPEDFNAMLVEQPGVEALPPSRNTSPPKSLFNFPGEPINPPQPVRRERVPASER
jgi:hypothetical protein